jgi:hypothetical protein
MPFPLLAMLPSLIGAGGSIASGILGGKAKGQTAEQNAQQSIDQLRNDQYRTQQGAELSRSNQANEMAQFIANLAMQQRAYADQAPQMRANQVARGNLMANMQDVSASHPRANVVHFSGGMRPSALGPQGRAAGAQLGNDAMARLMKGDQFDPVQTTLPNMLTPPQIQTQVPKSSFMDKLLGGVAIGGAATQSLLPQLLSILSRPKSDGYPTTPGMPEVPSWGTQPVEPMPQPPVLPSRNPWGF